MTSTLKSSYSRMATFWRGQSQSPTVLRGHLVWLVLRAKLRLRQIEPRQQLRSWAGWVILTGDGLVVDQRH